MLIYIIQSLCPNLEELNLSHNNIKDIDNLLVIIISMVPVFNLILGFASFTNTGFISQ